MRLRTWLRSHLDLGGRTIDAWSALTDQMEPPDQSLEQLRVGHPEIGVDEAPLVWQAYLQWVRIRGRASGRATLCQPSMAVDELVLVLARYPEMRDQLPPVAQRIVRIPVRDPSSRQHLDQSKFAGILDEFPSTRMPLLFRVDEDSGIAGAMLYRQVCLTADCVERSERGEAPEPDRTCLHGSPQVVTPHSEGGGTGFLWSGDADQT